MLKFTPHLSTLIRWALERLRSYIGDPSALTIPENRLLLYQLCVQDNFSEMLNEVKAFVRLFPILEDELASNSNFEAFAHLVVGDKRLQQAYNYDSESVPGWQLVLPYGFLISILWRYLNTQKSLVWNQTVLDAIISESDETFKKKALRIKIVVPLLGLNGQYDFPECKLPSDWTLRPMKNNEQQLVKHVESYLKLPTTMVYTDSAPPILRYALVTCFWNVPLPGLAAGWNVIDPAYLPLLEIEQILAVLQVATALNEPGPNYSIYSPFFFYQSDDWMANPYANPFSPNTFWPLNQPLSLRRWFPPPSNWGDWVRENFDYIERASPTERLKLRLALRWFAQSVRSQSVEDRLIKIFIALETLYLPRDIGRSRQSQESKLAHTIAPLLHPQIAEQRKWRRFIKKIHKNLRNPLFHDGWDEVTINNFIASDPDFEDLVDARNCVNMLEIAFQAAWNESVLISREKHLVQVPNAE